MPEPYSELFDLFWENSKFSEANIGEFQKRIEAYSGTDLTVAALQYPFADIPLPAPKDRLMASMRRRQSTRTFSNKPLSLKQIGSLMGAFSVSETGGRVYPSAGATHALEVFCIVNNGPAPVAGKICYYNHDNHSLSVVAGAPAWPDYGPLLNLDTAGTVPALAFFFVLFPDRVTRKYGERGGRFALIEVGHAAQNLALRLTEERLVGVETGGLLDDRIKALLGLEATNAFVALGFACG